MNYLVSFCCIMLFFSSCRDTQSAEKQEVTITESIHPDFVIAIENAHQKGRFYQNDVVCFYLDLTFGGQKAFEGKIYSSTNSSAIRMDSKDGHITIFKDGKYYINYDSVNVQRAKSSIHTWQYFFMLPYKLSDPGTKWQLHDNTVIQNENLETCQLSFTPGTGDAPDDWYIVHSSPESHLIQHAGYIVTGGKRTVEEAEKNAHAISYKSYEMVDSIPISTFWRFSNYNRSSGISDSLGFAHISNILFLDDVDIFSIIEDASFIKI